MTTITVLAALVANEAGENYSNAKVKTVWDQWVIEAVEGVLSSGRWHSLNTSDTITTVNTTRTYDLDATIAEVRAIQIPVTGKPLSYTTIESLLRHGKLLATAGVATDWYVDGATSTDQITVGLYPTPNGVVVYDVMGLLRPALLTTSSEIPLGLEFDKVIRNFVRAKAAANEKNFDEASWYQKLGDSALQMLNSRFVEGPRPGSRLPALGGKQVAQLPAAKE